MLFWLPTTTLTLPFISLPPPFPQHSHSPWALLPRQSRKNASSVSQDSWEQNYPPGKASRVPRRTPGTELPRFPSERLSGRARLQRQVMLETQELLRQEQRRKEQQMKKQTPSPRGSTTMIHIRKSRTPVTSPPRALPAGRAPSPSQVARLNRLQTPRKEALSIPEQEESGHCIMHKGHFHEDLYSEFF